MIEGKFLMANLVEFRIASSGSRVAIHPDNVVRVGTLPAIVNDPKRTFIRSVDGSSVDVIEEYETVLARLRAGISLSAGGAGGVDGVGDTGGK